MKTAVSGILLAALCAVSGCESTGTGSGDVDATVVYHGSHHYDPWYHGHGYYIDVDDDFDWDDVDWGGDNTWNGDINVSPPPGTGGRPPGQRPERPGLGNPRPSHPIARPPGGRPTVRPQPSVRPKPAARSRPSVPSRARPANRSRPSGGGGGGRRAGGGGRGGRR